MYDSDDNLLVINCKWYMSSNIAGGLETNLPGLPVEDRFWMIGFPEIWLVLNSIRKS